MAELVGDLQDGIFAELKTDAPKIDPLRAATCAAYLDILKAEFQPTSAPDRAAAQGAAAATGERAAGRRAAGARGLEVKLAAARNKATDVTTRAHIDDLRSEIGAILAPDKKK